MSLTNKIAIVTGAGSGIGKATAMVFAREGAMVAVADIRPEAGQQTRNDIAEQGGTAIFIPCNVAKYPEVENLFTEVLKQYGQLDIVVNNAGIGPSQMSPTAESTLKDWDRVIAVNQSGVFYGMKLALRQMKEQQQGCIVNIASLAGLKASPNNISYAASKFAVVGMTKAAAMEYARYGIRVNAICPGYTRSELFDRLLASHEDMEQRLRKMTPLGRFGEPEEIAEAVLYFCKPEAAYITGQTLVLDGGISL